MQAVLPQLGPQLVTLDLNVQCNMLSALQPMVPSLSNLKSLKYTLRYVVCMCVSSRVVLVQFWQYSHTCALVCTFTLFLVQVQRWSNASHTLDINQWLLDNQGSFACKPVHSIVLHVSVCLHQSLSVMVDANVC
jgi:hypothetical protein